jgi:hypothetical protein
MYCRCAHARRLELPLQFPDFTRIGSELRLGGCAQANVNYFTLPLHSYVYAR